MERRDDLKAELTINCHSCGKPIVVPWRWENGMILPRPSQIRIQVLEWRQDSNELIVMETAPDTSCIVQCDPCRAHFIAGVTDLLVSMKQSRLSVEPIPEKVM